MIRRLIVGLIFAAATLHVGQVFAQATFPAPLPGQTEATAGNSAPIIASPAFGGGPVQPSGDRLDICMKGFVPLREEAEKRSKLIKAASDRRAPPDEACKLIGNFGQAELKMIKYVEASAARCGTAPQTIEQLRNGHRNTEKIQKQVCAVAQQRTSGGPRPNEVLGPGDFWPASAPFPN
ncbi:hypothetical protein CQ14_16705 [Bradyrhizobium lablabi]|uniref:Uncharacterized protein n=1 Tax=Bradyrhizobium lablabi TaxID=722472 RepID=A0A0R3MJ41_9BRAD|nr:hypothetical protein CQ14_16705 [Bradyrhizobium lablabi]